MEPNELKEAWTALENRLKKTEELNESIILEMIRTKANKSISRLTNWEIFGAVIVLLCIPFIIFMLYFFRGRFPMWDIYMLFSGIICLALLIWQLYKVYGLMKVNLSESIRDNTYCINQYNIQMKREKVIISYVVGPVFAILGVLMCASMKATLPLWIFLACMIILATLANFWQYKRFYGKNINSILKSLDELKELKEEE